MPPDLPLNQGEGERVEHPIAPDTEMPRHSVTKALRERNERLLAQAASERAGRWAAEKRAVEAEERAEKAEKRLDEIEEAGVPIDGPWVVEVCPHNLRMTYSEGGWVHLHDGSKCDRAEETEIRTVAPRRELVAMTQARDLCKRQATEAGERYVKANARAEAAEAESARLREGLREAGRKLNFAIEKIEEGWPARDPMVAGPLLEARSLLTTQPDEERNES